VIVSPKATRVGAAAHIVWIMARHCARLPAGARAIRAAADAVGLAKVAQIAADSPHDGGRR